MIKALVLFRIALNLAICFAFNKNDLKTTIFLVFDKCQGTPSSSGMNASIPPIRGWETLLVGLTTCVTLLIVHEIKVNTIS